MKKNKPSSNSSQTLFVLIIISSFLGLFYWKWKKQKEKRALSFKSSKAELQERVDPSLEDLSGNIIEEAHTEQGVSQDVKEGVVLAQKLKASQSADEIFLKEQAKQEKVLGDFKGLIKMKIDLPRHLKYEELDLDEGIAGLHGVGPRGKEHLSVLATRKQLNFNQVLDYLNSSDSILPHVQKGDFKDNKKAIRRISPPFNSGIKSIQVIEGKKYQDYQVYAAFIERHDQAGRYLFVMKNTQGFFENNEGYLDTILNSLKTDR